MDAPLRAPREHGGLLAVPSLDRVGTLLADPHSFLDPTLNQLRILARRQTLQAARGYFQNTGEPAPPVPENGPWFVAGHQPELFHPGVWVKNFALGRLAIRHAAVGLNLIVDNDTAKSTSLRVPARYNLVSVPFDYFEGESPYESRRIIDKSWFNGFAEHVQQYTQSWPFRPILDDFWPDVVRQDSPLLGEKFVRARRHWERSWGVHNLEVPMSRVCRTEAFFRFVWRLLNNLPSLHEVYNAIVRDYRHRHGIRSKNHPVPDLAAENDWLEAPFWGWQAGAVRRGRPMVRLTGNGIAIRVGAETWPTLPVDVDAAWRSWQAMQNEGYALRTRALTTTLYARLFLADVFLHGIGGGLYDELTDEIVRQVFDVKPPPYVVLSATLLLPLQKGEVTGDDVHRLARLERDLWWNPQRHLPPESLANLQREKQIWIERPATSPMERRNRFEHLRAATEGLRPAIRVEWEQTAQEKIRLQHELLAAQTSGRRDFSFCLYPAEMLREFFADIA